MNLHMPRTTLGREDQRALRELLVPAAEDVLIGTAVSPRANSVKNDDAGILEPVDGAA